MQDKYSSYTFFHKKPPFYPCIDATKVEPVFFNETIYLKRFLTIAPMH